MRMSPEMQAQYEDCRLRMHALNRNFSRYLWLMIALGAVFFVSTFFVGALSTLDDHVGAAKFYWAMGTGVMQILLAAASIALGWMTAAKTRIPSMILLGIYTVCILLILLNIAQSLRAQNIFLLLTGIAINVWAQMLCNEHDALKEMAGYPLFSVEADTPAEYEAPLHVTAKRTSGNMDTVGGETAAVQTPQVQAAAPAVRPSDITLDDFIGSANGTAASAPMPQVSDGITLAAFEQSASGSRAETGTAALPQADPADMLADMTAIPSHAVQQGDPDALPTPEDVRARLAKMRSQREKDS